VLRSRSRLALAAGTLSFALIAAACGGDDGDTSSTTAAAGGTATSAASGGSLSGSVTITGSSTVEPISAAVAEDFQAANPGVTISADGPGTGDGFKIFCAGEADVTGASRPIRDAEIEACTAAGIEFIELKVAIDGLTVATNPNNSAVECLDTAALYALTGPESTGFNSWADANEIAAELGSAYASLPDAPLIVVGPGEESGTYDTYVEFAIADFAEERGQDEVTRPDYQSSPNDNIIVQGIEGADTALGWVGYAFYKEEGDKLKGVAIDTGDGCIAPTDETIADQSYPFSRLLYIYVDKAKAASNPAVQAYMDFFLSDEGMASVPAVGYVSLPAAELEEARATLAAG
jgi:phosphate transport system substrate-binding protein